MNTHAIDTAKLVLERLEVRKTKCYSEPSPYIEPEDEWLEIVIKIKELQKLNKKS